MAFLLCYRYSASKVQKLLSQIQELLASKKASRSSWRVVSAFSCGPPQQLFICVLAAPLYFDLHSPPSAGYFSNARQWSHFLHVLSDDATLCRQVPGLFFPNQGR